MRLQQVIQPSIPRSASARLQANRAASLSPQRLTGRPPPSPRPSDCAAIARASRARRSPIQDLPHLVHKRRAAWVRVLRRHLRAPEEIVEGGLQLPVRIEQFLRLRAEILPLLGDSGSASEASS